MRKGQRKRINDFKEESEQLGGGKLESASTLHSSSWLKTCGWRCFGACAVPRKCFKGDNRLYHIPRMLTRTEAGALIPPSTS